MPARSIPPAVAIALLIAFCANAGAALYPDDLMNIYDHWQRPWSIPRPVGGLFYGPLYHFAGLNPVPYRVVCWILLVGNIGISYFVLLRLTRPEVAAVSIVLLGYHAYLADLYLSSGTIYDVLAYGFFYGALAVYISGRSSGNLTRRHALLVTILFVLACGAKEIGVTLPIVLLAYEVFFRRRHDRQLVLPLLLGLIATGFAARAIFAGSGAVNPAYRPAIENIVPNLATYAGMMFYVHDALPIGWVLAIVAAAIASAIYGPPVIRFAVIAGFVTSLPALLIAPRSFYILYIPCFWWAIAIACGIAAGLRAISSSLQKPAIAALISGAILVPFHARAKPYGEAGLARETTKVSHILAEIERELPALPAPARILFVEDPFEADDWFLTFLFRLRFHDPTIDVFRLKRGDDGNWSNYDHVFALSTSDGALRRLKPAS